MSSLVFAIISGPSHGWTSGRVLASAAVALVVLSLFAYWESRIPYPMLDLHFFSNRRFTGAVAGAVLIAFGMGGSLFLLTQHLQFVLGYGPLEAGLRTAPLALTIVALNFTGLSARWTAKLGTPVAIGLGMVLMSAGLVAIATLADRGYPGTLLGLLLIGAAWRGREPRHGARDHERDSRGEGGERGRGQRDGGRVRQRSGGGRARSGAQLPVRGGDFRRRVLVARSPCGRGVGAGKGTYQRRVLRRAGDQPVGGGAGRAARWVGGGRVVAQGRAGRLGDGGRPVADGREAAT